MIGKYGRESVHQNNTVIRPKHPDGRAEVSGFPKFPIPRIVFFVRQNVDARKLAILIKWIVGMIIDNNEKCPR